MNIVPGSSLVRQLGGVAAACYPSGGREVWTWGAGFGPQVTCGWPAHSKPGVTGEVRSEGRAAWVLERRAPREAGNRAAQTSRSG